MYALGNIFKLVVGKMSVCIMMNEDTSLSK